MTGEGDKKSETKRDRVRRLVLLPLEARGFRFPKGVAVDVQRKRLDDMADDLAYMSDAGLMAIEESLRSKGDGSARCFWPRRATVTGLAQAFEDRPMSELPNLLSWFRSAAGASALAGDRLVAEYLFFRKNHHPPKEDRDVRLVGIRAAELRDRVLRIKDRVRRGKTPMDGDVAWLRWYDQQEAHVLSLLAAKEDAV